ncbi:MAG: hypothetical protein A2629_00265 [Candidatus Levybacteria bacterium RIFCSPHIGHO2_01_FULL_41_15]|nr:MAG: hypothetical protein A2629_00265 [Candidatus Levybacteria bacterium RIFCSPHIGHO2_01_FULL_41_15]
MKIAFIGGHLSPALSLIGQAPKNWEIIFIGRKYVFEKDKTLSPEYKTIKNLGILFEEILTGRLQRKFTKNTIPSLLKLPGAFFKAYSILKEHKPDAVLGFGGYVQIPVVFAAFFLKIPVVLHEQTRKIGLSNKLCAFFAKKICISWRSSFDFFPKQKTILTGIPLRKELVSKAESQKRKVKNGNTKPLIFITGGSSGSHFINKLIEDSLEKLLEKFLIIHQTGDSEEFRDYANLKTIVSKLPKSFRKDYFIKKFIDPQEMGDYLFDSDLVISRSGINTVSELILFKKPSILIPIPFSQINEQMENAKFLKDIGLSEIIEQKKATPKLLFEKVTEMFKNIDQHKNANTRGFIDEHAAQKIVKIIEKCIEKK